MGFIFRLCLKDARHLWPQIVAFAAMLALYGLTDSTYTPPTGIQFLDNILTQSLLSLSCWMLVAAVVQEDSPVGSEQYWLTRPFGWPNLLASKVLFIALFVNLPIFIYHCVVLAAFDFSPFAWMHVLLWRQVFITAFMILPAAALAAVTRNLWQTFGSALIILVILALNSSMRADSWGRLSWMIFTASAILVSITACCVLLVQYARRWTLVSNTIIGAALILLMVVLRMPPWGPAYSLQAWLSPQRLDDRRVHLSYDPTRSTQLNLSYGFGREWRQLVIPVRVDNVPPGAKLQIDWTAAEFSSAGLPTGGPVWLPIWLILP
jgi:hypothetical protein